MTGDDLRPIIGAAVMALADHTEEFRELDAALGDGDLGITVEAAARAVHRTLLDLPEGATPSEILAVIGPVIARANPSTYSALVAGAVLAGAKAAQGVADLHRADLLRIGRAAAESIRTRGKSELGDKTVLDALIPSLDAVERAEDDQLALHAAVVAAQHGAEEARHLVSRRGRAAWIGERGRGLIDPGAAVYCRFLESLEIASRSGA